MKRDLIVTGIPRAGTTLTAALIDGLDDTVCLSEPSWQDAWPREFASADIYVQRLVDDFARVRAELLAGNPVVDRRGGDGSPVSDYFERPYQLIDFKRADLSDDFLLGMKHNAHYSCVLKQLVAQPAFNVIAIVRHPLDVIRSWQSVDIPIRQGRLPAAERFWPEIADIAQRTDDILLRQVLIYERFCERFLERRDVLTLLRYEDIVRDTGVVSRALGKAFVRLPPVEIRERPRPDTGNDATVRRYLKTHGANARALYPDI
jgi:hypothetical protein